MRGSDKSPNPHMPMLQACHYRWRFTNIFPTENMSVDQRRAMSRWRSDYVQKHNDRRMNLIGRMCAGLTGSRKQEMMSCLTQLSDPRRMDGCQSMVFYAMG